MSKRITAREAQRNYIMTSKNVFEIAAEVAAGSQIKETIKLIKVLKCRKGYTIAQAAPIAKRAYRLGVRVETDITLYWCERLETWVTIPQDGANKMFISLKGTTPQ